MISTGSTMEILKSTRHSKITGDLGECLTLYWLSKHNFECARIDHTGIDIFAKHPKRNERLGISVKSRSRTAGKEEASILIERKQFERAKKACEAFDCVPYFSIFVDAADAFRLYLLPMSKLEDQLGTNKTVNWKMTAKSMAAYRADRAIALLELRASEPSWGALAT